MTTASQLATRCAVRFKDENNAVVSASAWLSYLNEAYNQVNAESPWWPWLETSEQTLSFTANNRVANLPTDVLTVNWAYNVTDDFRLIDQMGRGDFFHQDHIRSEIGQPVTYRLRGSTMELNAAPSQNTTVVAECNLMPTALAVETYVIRDVAGAAAGNITVAGITTADTIISVVGIKDSDQSLHDYTSEFTITATNTINNIAGTATTGYHLAVTVRTFSGANAPVWPSAYHDLLIDGALAAAYLDDGNPGQATAYAQRFEGKVSGMKNALLGPRTEANAPIRDTFWS